MALASSAAMDSLCWVFLSFLFFLLVAEPFAVFLVRCMPIASQKKRAKATNSLTSMMHSTISGVWSNWLFAGLLVRTQFSTAVDLLSDEAPLNLLSPSHAIAVSAGYFLFDIVSMWRHNLLAGVNCELLGVRHMGEYHGTGRAGQLWGLM